MGAIVAECGDAESFSIFAREYLATLQAQNVLNQQGFTNPCPGAQHTLTYLIQINAAYLVIADCIIGHVLPMMLITHVKNEIGDRFGVDGHDFSDQGEIGAMLIQIMKQFNENSPLDSKEKEMSLIETRCEELKGLLHEKEKRIKYLEASRRRARDQLENKMVSLPGSIDTLCSRDMSASSLMKKIEAKIDQILWNLLESHRYRTYLPYFESCGFQTHKVQAGRFGFQTTIVCTHCEEKEKDVQDVILRILKKAKDKFIRNRYGPNAVLKTTQLIEAIKKFDRLRLDRNFYAHLFESDTPANRRAQRAVLSDLQEMLQSNKTVASLRLQGMEPLLRLEVDSRLHMLHAFRGRCKVLKFLTNVETLAKHVYDLVYISDNNVLCEVGQSSRHSYWSDGGRPSAWLQLGTHMLFEDYTLHMLQGDECNIGRYAAG
ncbi:hypothetical protein GOP47_0024961 [Adiantum capillus-veneris]|uniref:Uncharacterized protein n=1 Tax=Adiantum capillus-veneris TaxID=13818 RepID=A0A9D4U5D3_ADICA|nr:hypothetical protein GOP47_0024961 [Adiantum capillus-veneris]